MAARIDITTEALSQTLPYNLEAEQSVLGAILIDSQCLTRVMEFLRIESFYRQQHQEIFSILVRMFTSGQPIDFITVLENVKREGVFPTDEDAKIYLTQLAQIVPSTANVESYAKIVQEKQYVRSLMVTAQEIMQNASDAQADARTLMDMAEQRIFEIRQGRDTTGLVRIDEVIMQAYETLQRLSSEDRSEYVGLSTGFADLDRVINGLGKSDLILLAARPAMGKTSFALNIATNVATKQNKKVAIFSLEMSAEQLVSRIMSSEALVPSHQLRTGTLTPDDWVKLAMSSEILAKSPIYIDDTPGITIPEMKAKLRRLRGVDLVVIDYLQLMSSGRRIENRVQEVSEITRSLKILAKELNVPVITLSQLSRGPDSRSDHRPMLSDLRESGSIEQDADMVLFLYRDEYYDRDSEDHGIAECIIAKNRHGETDSVKLRWNGEFTRFAGLEWSRDE